MGGTPGIHWIDNGVTTGGTFKMYRDSTLVLEVDNSGNVTVYSGNVTMVSGSLTIESGSLTLNSGTATIGGVEVSVNSHYHVAPAGGGNTGPAL